MFLKNRWLNVNKFNFIYFIYIFILLFNYFVLNVINNIKIFINNNLYI